MCGRVTEAPPIPTPAPPTTRASEARPTRSTSRRLPRPPVLPVSSTMTRAHGHDTPKPPSQQTTSQSASTTPAIARLDSASSRSSRPTGTRPRARTCCGPSSCAAWTSSEREPIPDEPPRSSDEAIEREPARKNEDHLPRERTPCARTGPPPQERERLFADPRPSSSVPDAPPRSPAILQDRRHPLTVPAILQNRRPSSMAADHPRPPTILQNRRPSSMAADHPAKSPIMWKPLEFAPKSSTRSERGAPARERERPVRVRDRGSAAANRRRGAVVACPTCSLLLAGRPPPGAPPPGARPAARGRGPRQRRPRAAGVGAGDGGRAVPHGQRRLHARRARRRLAGRRARAGRAAAGLGHREPEGGVPVPDRAPGPADARRGPHRHRGRGPSTTGGPSPRSGPGRWSCSSSGTTAGRRGRRTSRIASTTPRTSSTSASGRARGAGGRRTRAASTASTGRRR